MCDCTVKVSLVPGGTGCGFEVTKGVAYSIGRQMVSVVIDDPCQSINGVTINGLIPPVLVNDGQIITVATIERPGFVPCSNPTGPTCIQRIQQQVQQMFSWAYNKTGLKLVLNKNLIKRIVTKSREM